jgi:uncharacterized protein YcfJ
MKKILIGTLMLTSTAAFADNVDAEVQDHYKTVTRSVPHTEYVCEYVQVPVYGRTGGGGASTFDKLGGAIIGGAIGNQFGGGSGKDALTVLGAIAGADIAGKKMDRGRDEIVGYRQEERCKNVTTYDRREETVYSHSTIRFEHRGGYRTLQFKRNR